MELVTLPVLDVVELIKHRTADLAKVGPEGYIHGYICVRPPCGKLPKTTVRSYDLKIKKDGGVVHDPSGYAIGHAAKNDDGSWTVHHADGTVTQHKSRADALNGIADRHNSGKTAAGLNGGEKKPEAKPVAVRPAAKPAVKPSPVMVTPKPKPAVTPKPAASPPASKPVSSGSERSGSTVWKTQEGLADLSPAEKASIGRIWYNKNFGATEDYLRKGTVNPGTARYYGLGDDAKIRRFKADIASFQNSIGKAVPFQSDVTLMRGINHPADIFGPVGSMNGKSFTDKGFVSTSTSPAITGMYSKGFGGSTALVTIHARKGTRALKVTPELINTYAKRKTPADVLQEYTFPPGTSFKILSDTLGPDGVRRMEAEVSS